MSCVFVRVCFLLLVCATPLIKGDFNWLREKRTILNNILSPPQEQPSPGKEPTLVAWQVADDAVDGADSSSVEERRGWLLVKAIGTGTFCLEKRIQFGVLLREDTGNTTNTSTFIELFGTSLCQPGDVGITCGIVRASVLAEAYQRGPDCVARVMADVAVLDVAPTFLPRLGFIGGANADGEALAICDSPVATTTPQTG